MEMDIENDDAKTKKDSQEETSAGESTNILDTDVDVDKNEQEIFVRTPEEIEEILKLANVKGSDVAQIVQSLFYTGSLEEENDEYKVLEIDDHLLQSIELGDVLTFRGDEDEPAVLCSATRTYEVKEAETSNTCLLVPNLKTSDKVFVEGPESRIIENVEVKALFNKYLELRECSPRLSKLSVILEPSSFKGLEYEKTVDKSTLYDWNKLQSEIQASDGELKAALPEYLVACMDGFYRLIAFEFEARALPQMLDLIEENSWEIDEIDKEVSYDSLKELIPEPVFDLLFQRYTEQSTKVKADGTPLYKYNEAKASRLLAHILLTACPNNNYSDFMEAWQMGSPDSIPPKEEYLYGIAIVTWNDQLIRKEVVLYPEANLPDNIQKRLNELFKVKEKWTVPEITPYIKKFVTRTQDVNAILTKYARSSTKGGIKYYSSKHGK